MILLSWLIASIPSALMLWAIVKGADDPCDDWSRLPPQNPSKGTKK